MSTRRCYEDQEMTWIGDLAGCRASVSPEAPALYDVAADSRYTFKEIDERARRAGTYLTEVLGLERGDAVCCLGRNHVAQIDLYLAAGKVGVIFAPLSFRLCARELSELLARIKPRALFYEDHFAELVESLTLPPSVGAKVCFGAAGSEYDRLVRELPPRDVNRSLRLRDTFLYIHTGGTTAVPKVCVISYRQMYWNGFDVMATTHWGGYGRTELLTFPLFHIGGWNAFHSTFQSGGESLLLREFDAGTVLRLIDDGRVSHFGAVEAMLQFLVAHPDFERTDLGSLHSINAAGAPCAPEVMEPFFSRGVPVTQVFGMTEAGPSNFGFIPADLPMETLRAKARSIGRPMMHQDFKIVDPETRREVVPGQTGVLCLRSCHNFDGYLDDPERTARVLDRDGWIYTGDLAQVDLDGYIYIKGRADNMFITGGENVSPEEIEQALLAHPTVLQAICVGVPDPGWGQVPFAKVVLKAGRAVDESALLNHCHSHLARFKVPKHLRFGGAVPLTGAGKLDRKALADEAEAWLDERRAAASKAQASGVQDAV